MLLKKNVFVNLSCLAFICLILIVAFYYQLFIDNALPCSLCYLQRVEFISYAMGLLILIINDDNTVGSITCFFSSIFGIITALLHILLELPIGMPTNGSAIFGVHMYGWSFIIFMFLNIYIFIYNIIFVNMNKRTNALHYGKTNFIARLLTTVFAFIIISNLISVFLEFGFYNMKSYRYHYWIICRYYNHNSAEFCLKPSHDDLLKQFRNNLLNHSK